MTEDEFFKELARLGFSKTLQTTATGCIWRHVTGENRLIQNPQYVPEHSHNAYIERIRRSIGLRH